MVLKVLLLSHPSPMKQGSDILGVLNKWRLYYRPPWIFLLHIIEIICILFFSISIVSPTIDGVFNSRKAFTSLLFPDSDEDLSLTTVSAFQDYIDNFLENLEKLSKDSFSNFYFSNPEIQITFSVLWKNGTTANHTLIKLTPVFFQHIDMFTIDTQFYTLSNDTDVLGCTSWEIKVEISQAAGSYCFQTIPYIYRYRCGNDIVSPDIQDVTTFSRRRKFRTHSVGGFHKTEIRYDERRAIADRRLISDVLTRITTNSLDTYVPPAHERVKPSFERPKLTLYLPMVRFGLLFVVLTAVVLFISVTDLASMFAQHRALLEADGGYRELPSFDQFHTSIGLWNTVFLVRCLFVLAAGLLLLAEAGSLTQYPSNGALVLFGVASFFSVCCGLRWFMRWPRVYRAVRIIVSSLSRMVNVLVGMAPVLVGLVLVGIFMFGFVSKIAHSISLFFEYQMSVTFGDSLYSIFEEFSDGSTVYNSLAFVYCVALIAASIWVFFTSYTATMTYVDHHVMSKIED